LAYDRPAPSQQPERAADFSPTDQREPPISDPAHISIAVCICTFRRPDGLLQLLSGLEVQRFSIAPAPAVVLIVVDNSPDGGAAQTCQSRRWTWPLHYLHEPRPGISYARNAALSAVPPGTDFIAMVDDDEVPAPDWLDRLLDAQSRSGADVIAGPAIPAFPDGTPDWITAGGIFYKPTNMHELHDLHPDPAAATCNVMMRAGLLEGAGLRFDPALALSGGEDKMLFQHLKRRGYTFAWAADAKVIEQVPLERANFAYMWREAFRRGSVKFYVKCQLKSRSTLHSARIGLRIALYCLAGIARDVLRLLAAVPRGRRACIPHILNIADQLGSIAGVLQIPNRHYRPAEAAR